MKNYEERKIVPPPPWRDVALTRHGFIREELAADAVPLLIGNGDMGGLAAADGLGIPQLWMADFFKNPSERTSLPAVLLASTTDRGLPARYRQVVDLRDGIVHTSVTYPDGSGYTSELFCSQSNKKLMILRLVDCSPAGSHVWKITTPTAETEASAQPSVLNGVPLQGHGSFVSWNLHSSRPLVRGKHGPEIKLAAGEHVTLQLAVAVCDGKADVASSVSRVIMPQSGADALRQDHIRAWGDLWNQCAVVSIPSGDFEALYFRSIYWLLSAAGSQGHLPGEEQFSSASWGMHPFTYGAAGWAVMAFTHLGLPVHARNMLEQHFRPVALRSNAEFYLTAKNPAAWSFAHEIDFDGNESAGPQWRSQRHLDGFAVAMFHRHSRYYPDADFMVNRTYPVLRGVAEFWRSLAQWDASVPGYVLPSLLSVSEDLAGTSVLDAVLTAKYCLHMAVRQAQELELDDALRQQWQALADGLHLPQNDDIYLEKLGDLEFRDGGGYFGVRAPFYLGYPTSELVPMLDRAKASRTLVKTWQQNLQGEGMIAFVANWFALADAYYGRGDHALEILGRNLQCHPDALGETDDRGRYFQTSYAAFALVPLAMLVQSYDGLINPLPALPKAWQDVEFSNIPAEAGILVSGSVKKGVLQWLSFTHQGREIYRTTVAEQLRITRNPSSGGSESALKLVPQSRPSIEVKNK